MADNYAALGNVFQAKATLQSLDNFPSPTIKEAARKKLAEIDKRQLDEQLKQVQDTLQEDTVVEEDTVNQNR
jgi:hypothetical protein